MSGSPAIVTGAGGFIGSHLAERLVAGGTEVRAIEHNLLAAENHLAAILDSPRFTLEGRDLLDIPPDDPIFVGAECVYHRAGISQAGLEPEIYWAANVCTFARALEVARINGIGEVIYPSSASVYGDGEWPAREDQALLPNGPYGLSKKMTEEMANCWYRWHGVCSIGFRIFNGYGPRADNIGAVGTFLSRIKVDQPITVAGDGSQRRDFIHVHDIVTAFVLGAESTIEFGIYNLASGQPRSVNELAKLMRAPVQFTPADNASPQDIWADISAISRDLGFAPSVNLEEGIAGILKSIGKYG